MDDLLRGAGLRTTAPRTAVLAAVRAHAHAGTDEIVDAARATHPALSREAVRESLRVLVRAQLVRRLHVGPKVRFEAKTDDHQHMVCTVCARIADVDAGLPPCLPSGDTQGFVITAAEVVYEGLCPQCAGQPQNLHCAGAHVVSEDGAAVPQHVPTVVHPREPPTVSGPTATVAAQAQPQPAAGNGPYGGQWFRPPASTTTLEALRAALEQLPDGSSTPAQTAPAPTVAGAHVLTLPRRRALPAAAPKIPAWVPRSA
ncbi:MAG: transcriptional repressor [Micrococcales bacterium]|nr:transcriptional repressor [Micrococcales bacterium]